MSVERTFYSALARLIEKETGDKVSEVNTNFTDYTERRGGCCHTCSYDVAIIEVGYKKVNGDRDYYKFEGSFAELIRRLSDD